MSEPRTLIDKLWSAHEIARREDGAALLWVDRHYVHEGSFHAFSQMKARGRTIAEPSLTFGVADHYVPTRGRAHGIADPEIAAMVRNFETNASEAHIQFFGLRDPRQGIVHVVGPEQGLTLPGLLVVCGDSHTSTHGAFGAYAFGIGASEVAHVLMTQTLWQKKPKRMRITVGGTAAPGIVAKDIALAIIARIHADGAQGHAIEFAGSAIRALTMEGRMTLCNLSIEAGGRCGVVAPDETTFAGHLRPRARSSTKPSRIGRRSFPITTQNSMAKSRSTPTTSRRLSLGAPRPTTRCRSMREHPTLRARPTRHGRNTCALRSTTWASRRAPN
jgi:3-isopropylmalate/(R)-2-methylmalate dehydratase large subunit